MANFENWYAGKYPLVVSQGIFDLLLSAFEAGGGEWQPIETAPKDGTHILLGLPRSKDQAQESTVGWWQEEVADGEDYMGSDAGFVDFEFKVFHPGRSFGNVKYQYGSYSPAYWMPLPNAPK